MIGIIRKKDNEWVVEYRKSVFKQSPHPKGVLGATHREYSTIEYQIHPNSLDDGKGYKREFFDGQRVVFDVIKDHGLDPYDNQIPGIDFKDVAKISYASPNNAPSNWPNNIPSTVKFTTKKPTPFDVVLHQTTHPDCGIHPPFNERYVRRIRQPQKRWDDVRELLDTGRFTDRDLDIIINTLKENYDPPRPK